MKSIAPALALLFVCSAAIAQNTPPPAQPYPAPIVGYVGRYLDSAQTPGYQFPNRTLRTYRAKTAPELNLMLVQLSGSTFAAYDLSTFPQRLASGPLATAPHGEKYLPPALSFDAQAQNSGFNPPLIDGQNFLQDFDYDERGNFYVAYGPWGVAVLDHTAHLAAEVQTPPIEPDLILSVKTASSYDFLISDTTSGTALYDVTNPSAPTFVRMLPVGGITSYAKSATTIAVTATNGTLSFFTPSALVSGGAASRSITPSAGGKFTAVASDGFRFFATINATNGSSSLDVLTPQPDGSYAEALTPLGSVYTVSISYGGGYVAIIAAQSHLGPILVRLGATPQVFNLISYFNSAYPATGYRPSPQNALPFTTGGGTYLLGMFGSIGDAFVLAPAQALPATSTLVLAAIGLALALIAVARLR